MRDSDPALIPLTEAFTQEATSPREPGLPVANRATGEIFILESRCNTCLLNPAANAVPLPPGRRKQFTEEARSHPDGYVVCHSTMPPVSPPGTQEAMCRGYTDSYGLPAAAKEAIASGVGHLVEIPAPSHRVADVSVAR
ncbi:hypothetical protein [Streptomyces sp. NPDC056883]|uniref:hypothetical protein n=1 Tax=Streptomyces sp. NPDC056883 TaxID=3345959 RepID=UPI00368CC3A8